uniref:hypothetical protein n=1 Tax=Synechococcus sp. UW106 TaxID=368495 RepID=UPI000E0EC59E|nr:hypothetical protein [Synechococcus sp. UW106]
MPSSENLFLDAFGGESSKQAREVSKGAKYLTNDERAELFQDGFGHERTEAPRPHLGQNWRINVQKTRGLSFGELYQLQDLQDVAYRNLPDWVIDGGYAEPTAAEKRYQKAQFEETGLTQSERNSVFNQFAADVGALAVMSEKEILRDSPALDYELASTIKRYGQEQVIEALKEESPKAAEYFAAKLQVQAAEAKAAAIAEAEQAKGQSVAEEIRAAQEAINAMQAETSNGLKEVSAEVLQAELTRRANQQTREGADQE